MNQVTTHLVLRPAVQGELSALRAAMRDLRGVVLKTDCARIVSTNDLTKLIKQLSDIDPSKRKERTITRLVTGSGDTIDRWNAGIGCTLDRASRIIQKCSDLWPDAHNDKWPASIPRPSKQEDAA